MKSRLMNCFLIAALVAMALLTGCNSSNSTNGETKGNNEKVTLTLGYYSSGTTDKSMSEVIKNFQKDNPNIEIKTQTAPYGQFFQKLDTQIAAGSQPDIWLSDGVYVQKFAERKAIRDLTPWIKENLNTEDYYGFDFNKDTEGKYWAVPEGVQIASLFYNKDMFDKAGVDYPTEDWTWDDLKVAAAKLTIDSKGKNANQPGFQPDSVSQYGYSFFNITEGWFPILKSFGGDVLDESLQKSVVNSPENKEALNWIIDGMKKGVIVDPVDLESFQSPFSPFPSGGAAMVTGIYARTMAANEANINYDVTLLPKGPDGKRSTSVIANSWVISSKTDDKKAEAAWKFIQNWVTNDDVQKEWAKLGAAVPVKKSVVDSDVFLKSGNNPENKKAFVDSFEYAETLYTNAVWNEWNQKFTDTVYPAFRGETTVDEALVNADKEIQKVLDQFYKK